MVIARNSSGSTGPKTQNVENSEQNSFKDQMPLCLFSQQDLSSVVIYLESKTDFKQLKKIHSFTAFVLFSVRPVT